MTSDLSAVSGIPDKELNKSIKVITKIWIDSDTVTEAISKLLKDHVSNKMDFVIGFQTGRKVERNNRRHIVLEQMEKALKGG